MKKIIIALAILPLISCTTDKPQTESPLETWQDGEIKADIIKFVGDVCNPASDQFVPAEARVAVFDNDGTLWTEKPNYIPMEYEFAWLKKQVVKDPSLLDSELISALINQDSEVLEKYDTFSLIEGLFGAHAGQREAEYYQSCKLFLDTAEHKRFGKLYKELTYAPVVELVHFLQQNEFNVFIVTGGEITFARAISDEIYNIPPENVIGSSVKYEYVSDNTGINLIRSKEMKSINDKHFKPANINLHIGRKPIFAAGNSDGDYEMMAYTLEGSGPSMALLIHHDDSEREFSYTHGTEKALAHADSIGWKVVSMKESFKTIF